MSRAQAHTLEGIIAALVVLGAVVFALQATAVTPLSASTSNQHLENQQHARVTSLLGTQAANGTIVATLVAWNRSAGRFVGAGDAGFFTDGGPPTAFGRALNRTYTDDNVAFNVVLASRRADNSSGTRRLVYMGAPSHNAVTAGRTVVLLDGTQLRGAPGTVAEAAAAGEFYATDAAPASPLFTLVEVRITVWRI